MRKLSRACAHARFDHHPTVELLVAHDVVGWAERAGDAVDERAEAWGLGRIPAHVLHEALTRLGLAAGEPVTLREDDQRLLADQAGDVRLGRLRTLPTSADKLAYARGVLLPSAEYLRHVGQTRWGRIATALRTAVTR